MSQAQSQTAVRPPQVIRTAGWAGIVSGVAMIAGFASAALLVSPGQPGEVVYNLSGVVIALCMLPIALALHEVNRPNSARVSLIATSLGVAGMLVAACIQALLIIGAIGSALSWPVLPAFGLVGIWLLAANILGRRGDLLSPGLSWMGGIAGAGYILVNLGWLYSGPGSPLVPIGGLFTLVAYPIWGIWLGYVLLWGRGLGPQHE
jgi:hypothetical protein